jgi:hypothetical protein
MPPSTKTYTVGNPRGIPEGTVIISVRMRPATDDDEGIDDFYEGDEFNPPSIMPKAGLQERIKDGYFVEVK